MRLTGKTPDKHFSRQACSDLAFVWESSLVLPGADQAFLGQGQNICVHVIWLRQHGLCGTQILQKQTRGGIRQGDGLYDLGGIIPV